MSGYPPPPPPGPSGVGHRLEEAIELIREHYGERIDLAHLPQDDDARDVYETIQKADTIGMFQIESRAQMASLPRNNPQRLTLRL